MIRDIRSSSSWCLKFKIDLIDNGTFSNERICVNDVVIKWNTKLMVDLSTR